MTDVDVHLAWRPLGEVVLQGGKLEFPKPPPLPGVYWLHFPTNDGPGGAYIGQTDSLPRRFGNYRNPGPTQHTSLRINALLTSVLLQTGSIEVRVAVEGQVRVNGRLVSLNMPLKSHRLLAEGAAVVDAQVQGVMLANL